MVNIKINNTPLKVDENLTILEAAKLLNIKIPTLCHLNIHEAGYNNNPASCRVCLVELKGGRLVTSCSTKVWEGMEIHTESIKAIKARRNVVELMLSNHPKECLTCAKNLHCELQTAAFNLGVRDFKYEGEVWDYHVDTENVSIIRDPNKCILCGRCVTMCSEIQTVHALTFEGRGFESKVGSAYELKMDETTCTFCGQCLAVCPTGALVETSMIDDVWENISNPNKVVLVQTAPAVRAALGEEFGFEPGTNVTGKMVTALKKMGFDYVFDTNFSADLTIVEEGSELMERLKNGGPFPMITSCCPAWVNFVENQFPEFVHLPSSAKSPHEMFGTIAKTYFAERMQINPKEIVVVSVMPCVAKKYEAARDAHIFKDDPNVDFVITTRELSRMIKEAAIHFNSLEDDNFDDIMGESTGGADIFGATGGVIESTLRSVYERVTGDTLKVLEFEELRGFSGIKTTTVSIAGKNLKIAVTNGLGNVRTLLEGVRDKTIDVDVIEVMACPGGCVGGAGQPYHHGDLSILTKRANALYTIDRNKKLRISHQNPQIKKLYDEYLGEPYSEKAHKLLHTKYKARPRY